jgi:pimeloyl-ACP methyl ester carboxylesterase
VRANSGVNERRLTSIRACFSAATAFDCSMRARIFVFFLASALMLCSAPQARQLQPQSQFAENGAFMDWRGHSIYYVDRGRGEPLILIHGFGASLYSWRHVIGPLSESHRVIAVDLIGFGFSDKPDIEYSVPLFAEQIVHVMDRLGLPRAVLVGNSMGGRTAATIAVRHPERARGLVLIDPALYMNNGGDRPLLFTLARQPCLGEFLSLFNSRSRVRAMMEDIFYDDSIPTEADVDTYYAPLTMRGGSRAALSLLRNRGQDAELEAALPRLRKPTLIVWGAHDKWIPAANGERLKADIPGSSLLIIENAGHAPQEETPAPVIAAVSEFAGEL